MKFIMWEGDLLIYFLVLLLYSKDTVEKLYSL
jgi:hypothetical protein